MRVILLYLNIYLSIQVPALVETTMVTRRVGLMKKQRSVTGVHYSPLSFFHRGCNNALLWRRARTKGNQRENRMGKGKRELGHAMGSEIRDKQDRGLEEETRDENYAYDGDRQTEEETVMRVLSRNNQWDTRIPTYLIDYHVRARSKFHIVPVVVHPLQKYECGASVHRSSVTVESQDWWREMERRCLSVQ